MKCQPMHEPIKPDYIDEFGSAYVSIARHKYLMESYTHFCKLHLKKIDELGEQITKNNMAQLSSLIGSESKELD